MSALNRHGGHTRCKQQGPSKPSFFRKEKMKSSTVLHRIRKSLEPYKTIMRCEMPGGLHPIAPTCRQDRELHGAHVEDSETFSYADSAAQLRGLLTSEPKSRRCQRAPA